MTCHELRTHFEDTLRYDFDFQAGSPEFAEHLASCKECRSFVETREALCTDLQLMRDSVPAVCASLDAAMLDGYRKHFRDSARATVQKRFWPARLAWTAAFAAMALLVAGLIFIKKQEVTTKAQWEKAPPQAGIDHPASKANPGATSSEVVPATGIRRAKSTTVRAKRKEPVAESPFQSAAFTNLPTGFSSLMYCDQLACGGALEMIRVRLPPLVAGLSQASSPSPVYADVLVGSDGVARGIRIVQ